MLAPGQNEAAEGRAEAAADRSWLQVKTRPLKAGMRLLPADVAACQNEAAEGRDEAAAGRCWLQVKMRPLKAEMRQLPADVCCRSK